MTLQREGHHELTCDLIIDFYDSQPESTAATPLLHGARYALLATCAVSRTPPRDFLVTNDARLEARIRQCLTIEVYGGETTVLRGQVIAEHAPIHLAFDAMFESESEWAPPARLLVAKDAPKAEKTWLFGRRSDPNAESVTVVFKPNPHSARQTAEMTRIWGSTIRVEGVPIRRGQPPDSFWQVTIP